MSEINRKHIETKTISTLCGMKGYACCFKIEAFASSALRVRSQIQNSGLCSKYIFFPKSHF